MSWRHWILVILSAIVAAAAGYAAATAKLQPRIESYADREAALHEAVWTLRDVPSAWNIQLASLSMAEPTTTVGPGVYLARIVDVEPKTHAVTFDWLGVTYGRHRSVHDTNHVQQTLVPVLAPMDSTLVQTSTPDPLGLLPSWADSEQEGPACVDEERFLSEIESQSPIGREYLDSEWWVTVFSPNYYSVIVQAP